MSEKETYLLLGIIPQQDSSIKDVLAIAYLKNMETKLITKHKILNRPTRFPRLISYPAEYIASNFTFWSEAIALEMVDSHPEETFLIQINQSTKKLEKLPFLIRATPFTSLRQQKERAKKAYKSMTDGQIDEENELLYRQALLDDENISFEETFSDSSIISEYFSPINSKRVSQLDPEKELPEVVIPNVPKRARAEYNGRRYVTNNISRNSNNMQGVNNTQIKVKDTQRNYTNNNTHVITPKNNLETSSHSLEKPTLENFKNFLKTHNDAETLAIYLADEKETIRPFQKEGLKNYFDDRTIDQSLFSKPPNNIKGAPLHVQEWEALLETEVTNFLLDNFQETDIRQEKLLTPEDRKRIRGNLRTRIMWCYLHSIDYTTMDGIEIANLIIYASGFVLERNERPRWEDFSQITLRNKCRLTFKKYEMNKPELPRNPKEISDKIARKLTINWPLKDYSRLFEVINILRTAYRFDKLPYAYYCPKPMIPKDPNDLDISLDCKSNFPITSLEDMANISEYKRELRRYYMVEIRLPRLYIQINNGKPLLPSDYNDVDETLGLKEYLPWNPEIDYDIYYGTLVDRLKEKYQFRNFPTEYFYKKIPLPEYPEDVKLPDHFKFPIKDKADIPPLVQELQPWYEFVTKGLSKEWIDIPIDTRVQLPEDMDEANRVAQLNLPINRTDIVETAKALRLHYKFWRIPSNWIKPSYEGKAPLPSIDAIAADLAKKTTDTIIIPIISKITISKTVKKLHEYYNFDKLPAQFFRIAPVQNPIFRKPENEFSL
jgi:hypothetical protein